jgi:hypothetical protein
MENLVQKLADTLNGSPPDSWMLVDVKDCVQRFTKEHESQIGEDEKAILDSFACLFLHHIIGNRTSEPAKCPRYEPVFPGTTFQPDVWKLVWKISPLLTQPEIAAFLDDLLIEHQKDVESLTGFNFQDLFQRTIQRLLDKARWLSGIPLDQRRRKSLGLADALDRSVELSLRFSQRGFLEEALIVLRAIGESFYVEKDWRVFLRVVQTFLRVIENRNANDLVSEKERRKLADWSKEMADGFAEPGEQFDLVVDANALAGRIENSLGIEDSLKSAKRRTAEQLEKVSDQRAGNGEYLAASAILDQAIMIAREADEADLASRLSNEKAKFNQKAQESGEMRVHEYRFALDKKHWTDFIEPFEKAGNSEEASHLWICHPSFIPDLKKLDSEMEKPVICQIASMSVLGGMGLQIAGEGKRRTGEELYSKLNMVRMLQLIADMFLAPALDFIVREKGVKVEHLIAELKAWPLMFPANMPIVECGLKKHFEGDYISSIHILTPQFEAVLRRAFFQAGFPDAVDYDYSKDEGFSHKERTFGNFLLREDIKAVLGDRFIQHFHLLFVDQLGLNLRNKVAHGMIEQEMLNKSTSSLILHCLMSLTRIRQKEVTEK